jgi:predicted double-glycine peptidase
VQWLRSRATSRSAVKRVFAALALTAGAALLPALAEPVRSLREIRQQNVVVQRWDVSCGAAALATMLTYHLGRPVSERVVAQAMLGSTDPLRVKTRAGFSLLDLKRYAKSLGFEADGYVNASLDDLEQLQPAIVPLMLYGFPHFVVYRGRVDQYVLLADPAFGNRALEVAKFERAWQNIAFVVNRPQANASADGPRIERQDYIRVSPDTIRSALRP